MKMTFQCTKKLATIDSKGPSNRREIQKDFKDFMVCKSDSLTFLLGL